jgi:rhodanese-related sulfurtransferase
MKTIVVILIFTALALILFSAYQYAINSPYRISSEEAKRRIRAGEIDVILDVRTDLEVNTLGFYPGSVHIQSADLETQMTTRYPDKGVRILAYCNTGQRARAATDKLHALGYDKAVFIVTPYTSLQ